MTLLTDPLPSASRTFSEISDAPGAMPDCLAVGVVAVAGDDAGNVGAVTVVVVRLGAAVYEVFEVGDPLIAVRIVPRRGWTDREVVVERGDARVDDCHTNPRTREAHQAAHKKLPLVMDVRKLCAKTGRLWLTRATLPLFATLSNKAFGTSRTTPLTS